MQTSTSNGGGELSCKEVLHCANRSYEKLLHSSLDEEPASPARGSSPTGRSSATDLGHTSKSSSANSAHLQFANEVLASCRCSVRSSSERCLGACVSPRSRSPPRTVSLRSPSYKSSYSLHSSPVGRSSALSSSVDGSTVVGNGSERYSKLRLSTSGASALSSPTGGAGSPRGVKLDAIAGPTSPKAGATAVTSGSSSLSLSPVSVGLQAAVDSVKHSSKSSLSPSAHPDYSHVSNDNIRDLQSIRYNLRHVLHGDIAGVEELLTSKLATIKRQESASFDTAVRSSTDVTQLINTSLHSENQLLRDTLDRERHRRKQFEKQTESLQGRLGEEQEQFTSALAALKKKDGMIDQLDKTLAKVVEGWQGHEGETLRYIEQLEKTQRQLAHDLSEQRELVASLEADLGNAVDDLAREQERASLTFFEKNNKMQLLEEELRRLSDSLEAERGRAHRLELERSATAEVRDRAEQQLHQLQNTLAEERNSFVEREQELVAKIDEISGIQITVLENEQKKASEQERHLMATETQLGLALRDAQNLSAKLEEAELDKERASADLITLKAKHESQMKQQEADLRLQTADVVLRLRQEWAERLSERETELSHVSRQQVTELHERHARQTGELTTRHHSELAELRARYNLQLAELGHKIDELEEELHSLRYNKRKMEAQQKEMTTRLQSMMTLHASEALKILTHTSASQPATSGALVLKAEVTTALSHHALQKHGAAVEPRLQLTAATAVTAAAEVVTQAASATEQDEPAGSGSDEVGADGSTSASTAAAQPTGEVPRIANGSSGKEEEDDDDYEDGDSVTSTDTYSLTPRNQYDDDVAAGGEEEQMTSSRRQQALQAYIQKLLTQSPSHLSSSGSYHDSYAEPSAKSNLAGDQQGQHSDHVEAHEAGNGSATQNQGGEHSSTNGRGGNPAAEGSGKQRQIAEDIAQLIARYGDPQHTPSVDEFLTYLRRTQNSAKERTSSGDMSAGLSHANSTAKRVSSKNGDTGHFAKSRKSPRSKQDSLPQSKLKPPQVTAVWR